MDTYYVEELYVSLFSLVHVKIEEELSQGRRRETKERG